ncbi:MAG: polyribonucleotide nucleotidyltransferase [Myxococcales bacterium]|nr:polyribonucleotide nucleotidyltransferase [Myxococcales bacterium]
MSHITKSIEFGGTTLTFETGKIAKQANGSIFITYGETTVLCTACSTGKPKPNAPFFPLMCDYQEKFYSAGRIPGSYFRREGRPTEKEVLTSRLIDRPARPLFPDGFMCDTQLIATTMSFDKVNDGDVIGMLGAFTAVAISDIPWAGPVVSVRVGLIDGNFIANPTVAEREESELDLVVAIGPKGVVMVEGQANFIAEAIMVDAIEFASEVTKPLMALVTELVAEIGKEKFAHTPKAVDEELVAACREAAFDNMAAATVIPTKMERYAAIDGVKKQALADLAERFPDRSSDIKSIVGGFKSEFCRNQIVETATRLDGRKLNEVRDITIEMSPLKRAHGSVLFTRGETQAIVALTLGTGSDDQRIELLSGMTNRRFMLHYNFLPFSVGEVKFLRGAGRREIGHGQLARRGLLPVLPSEDVFPYVLRSVAEITESNGSSSMATVCGTSLAMMDAGVPISGAVAGIAMGLIQEGDKVAVLSDILGDEDHFGDMDFKVVGNSEGISSLQMDIKIDGLDRQILIDAMSQAREGRLHILDKMNEAIERPRPDISDYAPRIFTILIDPDRIRDLIGPGGKHIRGIVSTTGAQVNVEDDGTVKVAATDNEIAKKAIDLVRMYTAQPEVGQDYEGKVVRVADFGAFVQIAPGMDGLCHISELADGRIDRVDDVCKLGDTLKVRVLNVERNGKIRLSHREAMRAAGLPVPEGKKSEGGDRGGDRGGRRGGGRGQPRGRDSERRRSRRPRGEEGSNGAPEAAKADAPAAGGGESAPAAN